MKVISWNLLHGQPLPPPSEPLSPEVARELLTKAGRLLGDCNVDVLGVQEVDQNQPRSSQLSQVATLADALSAVDWAFAPSVIGTPGEKWRALQPNDRAIHTGKDSITSSQDERPEASYGIGLISTIPVKKWHRLDLGRSWIGLPLAIPAPKQSRFGLRFIYVRDEPRLALAAELENGFTVAVTHLSFVPFVNYFQLMKIRRWMKSLPGNPLVIGDLNLGWGLPVRGTHWRSLHQINTYPSWGAKIQFDYITAHIPTFGERTLSPIEIPDLGISDHLPIGIDVGIDVGID